MSNITIDIEKQLSKLGKDIQQFVEKVAQPQRAQSGFNPDSDLVESDQIYSILMDLPGMNKKQIQIKLKDRVLTVSGERELYLEDGEVLKKSGRRQGTFSRSFALPDNVDTASISAAFKDGVLRIKISKTGLESEDSSQSIPIK
jgi:HSP20 family protein